LQSLCSTHIFNVVEVFGFVKYIYGIEVYGASLRGYF